MKRRITLTIDPAVVRHAKRMARVRRTSLSGLVEDLMRSASSPGGEEPGSFVDRWTGKFTVAESEPGDQRMAILKAKYGLHA